MDRLARGTGRRWGKLVGIAFAVEAIVALAVACSSSSSGPAQLGGTQYGDGSTLDQTTHDTGGGTEAAAESAADVASEGGSTGAEAGDGSACEGGGTVCNGLCTNTQTDPSNCGACSYSCGAAGAQCVLGKCQCAADAGQALCGTTCVDILTDPNNCGQCGHICEVQYSAGACAGGSCQPSVIASPNAAIWDIAVDSTYVWWTQPGTSGDPQSGALLRKAFAAGSNNDTVLDQLNDPRGIAIDNINVYWTDYIDTSVNQIKVAGGGFVRDAPQLDSDGGPILPVYPQAIDVAVDTTNVYWTSNTANGCILKLPIGNPGGAEPTVLTCGENYPWAITTDGTNVYWTDQGNEAANGLVRQMPVDGSTGPLTISSGESNPFAIAVDANNVYWTDNANPGWVKQAKIGTTGAATTLAQNEGAPYGIAIDSKNVYWTAFSDNTVNAVAIGGGTKAILASGQSSPSAITVDQVNVYWVNHSTGQILGLTK